VRLAGPKRGNGAYWGYKWEAKKESNRIRRQNAKREIRSAVDEESVEPPLKPRTAAKKGNPLSFQQ
jgi:hypothetical protein